MNLNNFKIKAKTLFKLATGHIISAKNDLLQSFYFALTEMAEGNVESANQRLQEGSKKVYNSLLAAAQIAIVSLPILLVQAVVEMAGEVLNNIGEIFKTFLGYTSEAINEIADEPEVSASSGRFNACRNFLDFFSNLFNNDKSEYVFVDHADIDVEAQAETAATEAKWPKLMTKMFDACVKRAINVALKSYETDNEELDAEPVASTQLNSRLRA